eukprot:Em0013g926a
MWSIPRVSSTLHSASSPFSTKRLVVAFQSTSSDLEGQDHMYPSTVAPGDTRTPLTLGLMLSFSGDYVTKDAIPGVQIAVDTINAGDFLPGYRLQYS